MQAPLFTTTELNAVIRNDTLRAPGSTPNISPETAAAMTSRFRPARGVVRCNHCRGSALPDRDDPAYHKCAACGRSQRRNAQ